MAKKHLTIILTLLVLTLTGTTIYFAKNTSQPQLQLINTYTNQENGYQIEYPSFLTVQELDKNNVYFTNNTDCAMNRGLCVMGMSSLEINVNENTENTTIDQYLENWQKTCPDAQKIRILALPENFNENDMVEALRCQFPETPKQSMGGYSYIVFKNNKIFQITVLQGDTTILSYQDGVLTNMTQDSYDPLGDNMMRTFKFIEQPAN